MVRVFRGKEPVATERHSFARRRLKALWDDENQFFQVASRVIAKQMQEYALQFLRPVLILEDLTHTILLIWARVNFKTCGSSSSVKAETPNSYHLLIVSLTRLQIP